MRTNLKRHWNHHLVKGRQIHDIGSQQNMSREHLKQRFEIERLMLGEAA
jgi:hypothetical protein